MPRRRQHCDHCLEGSICNYCGKANYHPVEEVGITTRSTNQPQQRNQLELPVPLVDRDTMDAAAIQQALAALTAVVQAQQQNQQQQEQAIQQQGQALQVALQAITNNQNAVVSHPLPTFSGTVEDDVFLWLETVQRESIAGRWNEDRKRRMANAALRGVAAAWQWVPPVNVANDWAGWSVAFRETFRKRYTFVEWETMVKARQQLVGDSAA